MTNASSLGQSQEPGTEPSFPKKNVQYCSTAVIPLSVFAHSALFCVVRAKSVCVPLGNHFFKVN